MSQRTREFFESIPEKLDPAKTAGQTVTYRFDIDGAGSWRIDVDDGKVSVEESTEAADCVIRMKEGVLQGLIEGKQNPATAFMLGKIKVDGNMALALKLKELFF